MFLCLFSRWKRADQTEKEDCSSESHYSKNPTSQEEIRHSGVWPSNVWSVFISSSLLTRPGLKCSFDALFLMWPLLFNWADIELKEAQRFFAQKFSCGASVTAEDEIIIQGDFTDDIIDVIQEKWPEVRCLNFYCPNTELYLATLRRIISIGSKLKFLTIIFTRIFNIGKDFLVGVLSLFPHLLLKLLFIPLAGGWWQHRRSRWSQKVNTKYALLLKWMRPVTEATWPNVHIKSFYTYFIYWSSGAMDLATHLAVFS